MVFISRFPIISSIDIAPPAGSKDMARKMPAVVIDVPGTSKDPTLINVHLKCCFEDDDHFRRAVERHRLAPPRSPPAPTRPKSTTASSDSKSA